MSRRAVTAPTLQRHAADGSLPGPDTSAKAESPVWISPNGTSVNSGAALT